MYRRGWIPAIAVRTDDMYKYRIHPNDAHLAYGPVSTALREFAQDAPSFSGSIGYPAYGHMWRELTDYVIGGTRKSRLYYEHVDQLHRSLFLLILAEALADEGM
jgi:hypothetical protein